VAGCDAACAGSDFGMSDIKLFRVSKEGATEILSGPFELEKSLQSLIESNLETILSVRLLASQYSTGKTHAGRIDTLGIDENACPVILEYKRSLNESVINQGLFYLDWLLDHKAEVQILLNNKYGHETSEQIDWDGTRLLCIASDFTRYDEHAVHQIDRNIELIRYHRFGEDLLLLELVNHVSKSTNSKTVITGEMQTSCVDKNQTELEYALASLKGPLLDLFELIRTFLGALGDDVQEKRTALYIAFKRLKNFACVVVQKDKFLLYLKLNPDNLQLEEGFSRDVRNVGHWATGDLELTIRNREDFMKAKPLLLQSYAEN